MQSIRRVPGVACTLTSMSERLSGALRALLVLGWNQSIWRKTVNLPFAPFPGLEIRVDTYELIQLESVIVGDPGYDVTCICIIEGAQSVTRKKDFERTSFSMNALRTVALTISAPRFTHALIF